MTIARVRALVVVGVLLVFALCLGGLALANDIGGDSAEKPRCVNPPAAQPADSAIPAPERVRVRVLNATEQTGLASEVAKTLKERGFSVVGVGNDTVTTDLQAAGQLRYGTRGIGAARLLGAAINGMQPTPDARADATVDVVIGAGYTGLAAGTDIRVAARQIPAVAPRPSCGTPAPTAPAPSASSSSAPAAE